MMMMPHMMHPMQTMQGMPGMPGMHPMMVPGMQQPMQQPGQESSSEDEAQGRAPVQDQPRASSASQSNVLVNLPPPPRPQPSDSAEARDQMEITKSATFLRQLPRLRLAENLEAINALLESTLLCELSTIGLLKLLWVLTRIKPSTKIRDLRVMA